jgi:hypothetical protein
MSRVIGIFVHAPSLAKKKYYNEIIEKCDDVTERDDEIMLIIDWHVQDPYHGRPPHIGENGKLIDKGDSGFGYAPFGWKRGWIWMQNRMEDLLVTAGPHAIQYGVDPSTRVGWGFLNDLRDPTLAAYNDTFGILVEAIERVKICPENIIIPDLLTNQRNRLAIKNAETRLAHYTTTVWSQGDFLWEPYEQLEPPEEPEEPVYLDRFADLLIEAGEKLIAAGKEYLE